MVAKISSKNTIAAGHDAVTSTQGWKRGPDTLPGRLTQFRISINLSREREHALPRSRSLSLWVLF